ncbi:phosphonate metabolism protein/1,5-bisphosphokinase (PRPP-forming) PhnN [Roseobacter sp. YSTF-M11]|uniref:Ribose 1,5-bisphosphate phosphokinase PhnN n=1 Tax=Roseobacter insulae TaxID=2859783 RepID=A0A9X1FTZ5_9RHOB|nr:phosphonate metabolism protein/1,5-bisphosphokinase (PRPP-forming) PhnN [Roseobacter insulae]MBW4707374.1 phosphonate metabolism protein/1,5-bisphosphokinase (PRPP-forming) PhnN [Roseobacter insulae]
MAGVLIAVVGPSGVGKDTVIEAIVARDPRLRPVRRVITRPTDAGGETFEGVTREEFNARRAAGAFALDWHAHGLCYGIPVEVDATLASGRSLLVNLSRAVLRQAQNRFADFRVLSLTADTQVLKSRLAARGREDADQIEKRLARSAGSFPMDIPCMEVDNSGPLEETVSQVVAALNPARAG